MLTWINEKAKWIIVIFAAGIVVGLLAMDKTQGLSQNASHPVAVVQGTKIPYDEFDRNLKNVTNNAQAQAEARGQRLEDEQYAAIRNNVLNEMVAKTVIENLYKKNEIKVSDAEIVQEFINNPPAVRNYLVQEINMNLSNLQREATSQEDFMAKYNNYMATIPDFLKDSTFDQAAYESWVRNEARNWSVLHELEAEFKNSFIPSKQLQQILNAGIHSTSLEAKWNANRRLTDYELQVAVASASDFAADEKSVDDAAIKSYFDAHTDSFFVKNDVAQFVYTYLPVKATEADEAQILDYAKTNVYEALMDSSATTSFEDLARVVSEDPISAAKGGKLDQPAGLGVYVPEFEKAALALDSGMISAPIRSIYGYHIIKVYSKTADSTTGKVTADVGHILLTVGASSQTLDSLEKVLTGVKNDVDAGKSFEDAAKARNLPVATSNWVSRGQNIMEMGYLKGLSAYAWPHKNLPEENSKVSPVMKNNSFVAVAMKLGDIKAGTRSMEYFRNDIKASLLGEKSSKAAEEYLKSVSDKVKSADFADQNASIEKVKLSKLNASVEGYVPGFSYGSAEISKAFNAVKEGEWSNVVATEQGAVLFKVVSKKAASEEAVNAEVASEKNNSIVTTSIVNEYTKNLVEAANVENNLDLFYRD